MPNYTVTEIGSTREYETKFGPMKSYKITIKGDDGFDGIAEVSQKTTTPPPTVGQVIEGDLDQSNPKYAPKLKKAQKAQGGPPRGKSKQDEESIARAVAYKGAVELTASMSPTDPEQIEQSVERFFHHGLSLLHGTVAKPVAAPVATVSHEKLVDAYKIWAKGRADEGIEAEAAKAEFELKKTALGIGDVNRATPEQTKALLTFLTAAV